MSHSWGPHEHEEEIASLREGKRRAEEREHEQMDAAGFLRSKGYRRCDIPACNCGSWHEIEEHRCARSGRAIMERDAALSSLAEERRAWKESDTEAEKERDAAIEEKRTAEAAFVVERELASRLKRDLDAALAESARLKKRLDGECETCEGTGIMEVEAGHHPETGNDEYDSETCAECNGSGYGWMAETVAESARRLAMLKEGKKLLRHEDGETGKECASIECGPDTCDCGLDDLLTRLDAEAPRG